MLLLGVCLLSAVFFAVGNSLQHLAAHSFHGEPLTPARLALRLLRSRTWLLGATFALSAFVVHVVALSLGHVGVVQPLLLTGVVLAISIRPLFEGQRARAIEVLGAAITVAGLACYIRAGAIADTAPQESSLGAEFAAIVVIGVVLLMLTVRDRLPLPEAAVYGIAAGLAMGTGAGVIKDALGALDGGATVAAVAAGVLLAAVLELGGTGLNQKAYQSGPMTQSMPTLNVTSVVTGGLFGALVFGEFPRLDSVAVLLQVVGLGLATLGLLVVANVEEKDRDRDQVRV